MTDGCRWPDPRCPGVRTPKSRSPPNPGTTDNQAFANTFAHSFPLLFWLPAAVHMPFYIIARSGGGALSRQTSIPLPRPIIMPRHGCRSSSVRIAYEDGRQTVCSGTEGNWRRCTSGHFRRQNSKSRNPDSPCPPRSLHLTSSATPRLRTRTHVHVSRGAGVQVVYYLCSLSRFPLYSIWGCGRVRWHAAVTPSTLARSS